MHQDPKVAEKIEELQLLEHNIQNIAGQKQATQIELNEIETASEELEKSQDNEVFKISGNIMLKSNPKELLSELKEKKKLATLRLESVQKQEKRFEDRANELKDEVQKIVKEQSAKKE